MESKSIALALVSIMALSILASGFALAEDESEINDLTEISSGDTSNLDLGLQNVERFGLSKVTSAQGFATSDSTGYLVNALWARYSMLNISRGELDSLREKYRGNPEAMQSALQELSSRGIVNVSDGKLALGAGKDNQKFKLSLASSSDSSLVFNVFSISSDGKEGRTQVGTLTLTAKDYAEMTLWTGSLVLNSGTNAGTYSVSLASKSGLMKSDNGLGLALGKDKKENKDEKGRGQGFFKNIWDKIRGRNSQDDSNGKGPQGFGNEKSDKEDKGNGKDKGRDR